MYNLIISIAAALITFLALHFGTDLPWWGSLMISLPVMMVTFILIARVVTKKLEEGMKGAMRELQNPKPGMSREIQLALIDKAVRDLEKLFSLAPWQIYAKAQINSSIGMLYYIKRDFQKAFPYLEKGFFKNWVSTGMLAISYMKRQKREKMAETFDKAILGSPKESILYSLYAWCLADSGDTTKAIEILQKGLKKLPSDEILKENLERLQNGKKMEMTDYGEIWYQFHLESPQAIQKAQMKQAATGGMKRRIVRR
ncbi:MAG: hypothetical protein Fur0034_13150 [Desulfuromonadia bacterium]